MEHQAQKQEVEDLVPENEIDIEELIAAWDEFLDSSKMDSTHDKDHSGLDDFQVRNVRRHVKDALNALMGHPTEGNADHSTHSGSLPADDEMARSPPARSEENEPLDSCPADEQHKNANRFNEGEVSAEQSLYIKIQIHEEIDPAAFPPGTVVGYLDLTSNAVSRRPHSERVEAPSEVHAADDVSPRTPGDDDL
ncbi:hypothetical protein MPTK1_5g04970 [Marchantia polymorpha subsp. ruderalis]|uniref:Uncharacterized protein n=2 Tax=Marchantia polymorpha TaxID=3197 RepID=A0AAF6BF23_MARPO|nr:hypothetical protein MARPO_0027s0130 [Marchantia polymorpha]BBN10607.1 hypothetical protein Mp_5g04970 [Marchantia polymorpha subsp. ruderalis]|eukprot:PTQ43028.1 hypothetical protein MARPO_0027s0130 [Marchantia polymorpha]